MSKNMAVTTTNTSNMPIAIDGHIRPQNLVYSSSGTSGMGIAPNYTWGAPGGTAEWSKYTPPPFSGNEYQDARLRLDDERRRYEAAMRMEQERQRIEVEVYNQRRSVYDNERPAQLPSYDNLEEWLRRMSSPIVAANPVEVKKEEEKDNRLEHLEIKDRAIEI